MRSTVTLLIAAAVVAFPLPAGPAKSKPAATVCASPPQPVHEERFVPIGGIEQWVTINGTCGSRPKHRAGARSDGSAAVGKSSQFRNPASCNEGLRGKDFSPHAKIMGGSIHRLEILAADSEGEDFSFLEFIGLKAMA